jgi:uncharacterized membrane protein YeiH
VTTNGIDLLLVLDLIGVSVFAASGALLAMQRGFDLVGLLALGSVTALGGGVLRDLIINQALPDAFSSPVPVITATSASLATVALRTTLHRWRRTFLVFDAAGLGLFSVTGAQIAVDAGLGTIPAALLGVLTATGGGVIRDVLGGEPPQIFRPDSRLYAIPAAIGASIMVIWSATNLPEEIGATTGAVLVFAIRVAALRFGWRAPSPGARGK